MIDIFWQYAPCDKVPEDIDHRYRCENIPDDCSPIILNVTNSQKASVTDTTVKSSQMIVFFDHTERYKFPKDISH